MAQGGLSIESIFDSSDLDDVPEFVRNFEHTPGTQVDFGCGAVERLCKHISDLGSAHVLVVTDPGIARAGHLDRVTSLLNAGGVRSTLFDQVIANPTTKCVNACAEVARNAGIELIIGLGGGSSMDTAKGCNFILTNGGRMHDYWGHDKATKPMLPMIAIPTTAGTGSECQSYALISDSDTHAKMACGDKKAAARVAILDPELTITQPRQVTAHTGIDAIAHALETGVCNKRSDISTAYARAAFRMMFPAFPKVLSSPDDIIARSRMLLGAALAGTAIENSMLGAAHSAANPLTAHFGIVHGEAVGIMLPHVMRLNAKDPAVFAVYRAMTGIANIEELADAFLAYLKLAGMPENLKSFNVSAEDIEKLAPEAAGQWTAQFNPVAVDASAFLELYSAAN
ncbi:MAG: alcohol dehydrogenase [Verrucomicrobiales bacterium]|jgi:alcohol dehydrogenase